MTEQYITIVGFGNYYELRPFAIGTQLLCEKEPGNVYDSEAIRAALPVLGTVGYVANSVSTKANGTLSAGRIYEQVGDQFLVRVAFTTRTKVIAKIEQKDAKELQPALLLPDSSVEDTAD